MVKDSGSYRVSENFAERSTRAKHSRHKREIREHCRREHNTHSQASWGADKVLIFLFKFKPNDMMSLNWN